MKIPNRKVEEPKASEKGGDLLPDEEEALWVFGCGRSPLI
jgi:hypothetical protein